MRTCPECGADRDGAVRFCPSCGLDFWRAAAGQPAHAVDPVPTEPVVVSSDRSAAPFIAAGVGLLLVAAVAAVAMSGIVPSGMPLGRATPSPRALTANEALVHAFFREVRDPNAAFIVVAEGVTTFTGPVEFSPPIELTSTIRINGNDWAGTQTATSDGETILEAEVAIVDDIGYVRQPGDDWIIEEVPERLQPVSPFRRISTVTEIDYVDTRTVDGRPMHTLVVTKWLGGRDYSDILRRFARITSQVSRLEVLVDSFGVPDSATLTVRVVATDGRDTLTIDATATYRFSDWDDVEPIEPPESSS